MNGLKCAIVVLHARTSVRSTDKLLIALQRTLIIRTSRHGMECRPHEPHNGSTKNMNASDPRQAAPHVHKRPGKPILTPWSCRGHSRSAETSNSCSDPGYPRSFKYGESEGRRRGCSSSFRASIRHTALTEPVRPPVRWKASLRCGFNVPEGLKSSPVRISCASSRQSPT